MRKHRNPRDRVSNDVQSANPTNPDNFNPTEALQSLHLEIRQLEAIANAASEAVAELPFPSGREERRVFDRVYALVTKVANETSALVSYGDELITALADHLKARRSET